MANNKINLYLATSEEEYNLALTHLQLEDTVVDIRKLGLMSSSDFFGNDMDSWVIVYSSPVEIGEKIAKLMGQPGLDLGKAALNYLF